MRRRWCFEFSFFIFWREEKKEKNRLSAFGCWRWSCWDCLRRHLLGHSCCGRMGSFISSAYQHIFRKRETQWLDIDGEYFLHFCSSEVLYFKLAFMGCFTLPVFSCFNLSVCFLKFISCGLIIFLFDCFLFFACVFDGNASALNTLVVIILSPFFLFFFEHNRHKFPSLNNFLRLRPWRAGWAKPADVSGLRVVRAWWSATLATAAGSPTKTQGNRSDQHPAPTRL